MFFPVTPYAIIINYHMIDALDHMIFLVTPCSEVIKKHRSVILGLLFGWMRCNRNRQNYPSSPGE
jgi:hypothetical protein